MADNYKFVAVCYIASTAAVDYNKTSSYVEMECIGQKTTTFPFFKAKNR